MKTSQKTYEMHAYVSKYADENYASDPEFHKRVMLSNGRSDYFEGEGYLCIGMASVTLEYTTDKQTLCDEKLASLNRQLTKERAETEVRQNAILLQISKLQALEFDAS